METQKRLYRSESDKVIAGVCGGIGNYFGIDPTIIRVIFVLIAFAGGAGVLAYLILMIIIPSESSTEMTPKETIKQNAEELKNNVKVVAEKISKQSQTDTSQIWWGVILLAIGAYFLLVNFNFSLGIDLGKLWPLLLVGLGLAILVRRK